MSDKVPAKAWVVVFSGTAINLCLGILYAWSVWAKALINEPKALAGEVMTGLNAGWPYLTNSQAATPFSLCVVIFAILMIPGGRMQDKFGPKVSAITGGLFLAAGCIICGLFKSYAGLIIGFGIFGGIAMGIGYAAPTPAALKWFGPHKRGLVAGLVVGGFGAAAIYISPLTTYLMGNGITYSFVWLGIFFATVIIIAGSLLAWPKPGYVPPAAPVKAGVDPAKTVGTMVDWTPSEIIKSPQCYGLMLMWMASVQAGMMVISIAAPLLAATAKGIPFLVANAWIMASYAGMVNAVGRVGTGIYSDKIGRANAYTLNCTLSAICLFLMPFIVKTGNVLLLFLVVAIFIWQYGGGFALMPAFAADFYGSKNLGANYGIVYLGFGVASIFAKIAGIIKDVYGSYDIAFYISGVVLVIGVAISRINKRPLHVTEKSPISSLARSQP